MVLYENSNFALLKMRRGNLDMAAGCKCFVLGEEQKSRLNDCYVSKPMR